MLDESTEEFIKDIYKPEHEQLVSTNTYGTDTIFPVFDIKREIREAMESSTNPQVLLLRLVKVLEKYKLYD